MLGLKVRKEKGMITRMLESAHTADVRKSELQEHKGRKPLVTLCEFRLHVITNSLKLRE